MLDKVSLQIMRHDVTVSSKKIKKASSRALAINLNPHEFGLPLTSPGTKVLLGDDPIIVAN